MVGGRGQKMVRKDFIQRVWLCGSRPPTWPQLASPGNLVFTPCKVLFPSPHPTPNTVSRVGLCDLWNMVEVLVCD